MSEELPTIRKLGGEIIDLRRFAEIDEKNWGATNPSIGYHPKKGYAVAIRSSNYVIRPNGSYTVTNGGTIKARVYFSELDRNWKLKNLRRIDVSGVGVDFSRGLEDPKLFFRDGSWWFTCVTLEEHTPIARMAVARLDAKCTKIVEFEKLPGVDNNRPEKNWMLPYEKNPNFDFIYGPNAIIKDNKLVRTLSDDDTTSGLRGNTNLQDLGDETYLAVVHRTYVKDGNVWDPQRFGMVRSSIRDYAHYFARYDYEGNLIELSDGFKFHKPGVEFAAGIVIQNKNFVISFGREDVSSHLAIIPMQIVLKSLKSV